MTALTPADRRLGLTLAGGGLLVTIDTTVTVVVLPAVMADLHTTLATAQWITIGYLVAVVAVTPLAAAMMRRWTARRTYLAALTLFTMATLTCGTAGGIGALIAARIGQGLGGGLLNPVGQFIALRTVPRAAKGAMMATLGIPVAIGPAFGPPLAGWLIGAASWRWVFWVGVPIGVLAFAACQRVLPREPTVRSDGGDAPDRAQAIGFPVASALLVLALTLATNQVPIVLTVASLVGGCASMLVVIVRASASRSPLVDVRLAATQLRSGLTVLFLYGMAYFGTMSVIPLYVQGVRGHSALTTGLVMLPSAITTGITMQIASRLVDRRPPLAVVATGMAISIVGAAGLGCACWAAAPFPVIATAGALLGIGSGSTIMPTMAATIRELSGDQIGDGTTVMAITQQFGSAVGNAVIAGTLTLMLYPVSGLSHRGVQAMLALPPARRASMQTDLARATAATYTVTLLLIVAAAVVAATRLRSPTASRPAHIRH